MSILNIQPIQKRVESDGKYLQVHSIFYTIQGEGPFTGFPAVFVRLNGCNLQCPGCDTEYTSVDYKMEITDLASHVYTSFPESAPDKNRLVVVTGGEPFRQNLTPFIAECVNRGMFVQIETNGTMAPSPNFHDVAKHVTVVCSPKAGKVNKALWPFIDHYKYVLNADSQNPSDGLPIKALDHTASPQVARPHPSFTGHIYLQPMDMGAGLSEGADSDNNLFACIKACKQFGYILQLQLHKLIGAE